MRSHPPLDRATKRLRKPLPSREKRGTSRGIPALSGGVLAAAIYRGVAGLKAEVAMKWQAARARPPIWHPFAPSGIDPRWLTMSAPRDKVTGPRPGAAWRSCPAAKSWGAPGGQAPSLVSTRIIVTTNSSRTRSSRTSCSDTSPSRTKTAASAPFTTPKNAPVSPVGRLAGATQPPRGFPPPWTIDEERCLLHRP
jgi:hypothetical protein